MFVFSGCGFQTENPENPLEEPVDLPESVEQISENQEAEENTYEPVLISDFEPVCQFPELPTGCEVTSLTMVLNYYGFDVDKTEMADSWIVKDEVGYTDFRQAFVGNPRDNLSYGCYAPVIGDAAERFLADNESEINVFVLEGCEFEQLFSYLNDGIPVIVWGTLDCKEGYESVTWNVDGKELSWITPEHCMVLIGYDEDNVSVADPYYGDVRTYDRELFGERFEQLYGQAVVLE